METGKSPSEPRNSLFGTTSPSPRAFAIGTGVTCQYIGFFFLLGACVACALAAWLLPSASQPTDKWTDFLKGDRLPTAILTLSLVVTFLGGIAWMAVGVGLQGERPGSGVAAMIVSGILTALYVVATVWLIAAAQLFLPAVFPIGMALVSFAVFMLAAHSATVLRRFPPPPDQSAATPEFLDEYRQKRIERLSAYDPQPQRGDTPKISNSQSNW